MSYEVVIDKDYNNNIYIQMLPLRFGTVGIIFHKNNNYTSHHIYYRREIIKILTDNEFIIILKEDIFNNSYSKYTLQLTTKSLLEAL